HYDEFTPGRGVSEVFSQRGKGAAKRLLEFLCNLPRDRSSAVRTQRCSKLFEGFQNPEGRFITAHCSFFLRQGCESLLPPLLLGQEPLEAEAVRGESGGDQRRDQCSRAGQ